MKPFYTLLLLLSTVDNFAQEERLLKRIDKSMEVSEVVQLDSFSSPQLYFNATLFVREAFSGASETSQIKDGKSKTVATKGSFPVIIGNSRGDEIPAKVVFTLVIQSRDNMYRYSFNDFYFAYTEETGITSYASFDDRLGLAMTPRQWEVVEQQTEEFFKSFVGELKRQMAQKDILCKESLTLQKKKGKGKHAH